MSPPSINVPGYQIQREIGKGGMATVYLAIQESLDRQVALKVMSPALTADEDFCKRFLKEGKIIARLAHPHIITVHDIGAYGALYYMALEYAGAGNLTHKIRQGLAREQALGYVKQIAAALGYAHQHGFVHRDVKPENILFRIDQTLLLTDFGIAKAVGAGTQLTQFGLTVGTPYYMSPEQAGGEPVTAQSDLYSLGVMLYEMLTGERPFTGDNSFAIAYKHRYQPIPLLPEPLADCQPILEGLLAKEPKDRYATARDVIQAVEAVLTGNDISDLPTEPVTRVVRTPPAVRRWWPLGAAAVLLAAALLVLTYWPYSPPPAGPAADKAAVVRSPADFIQIRLRHLQDVAAAYRSVLLLDADSPLAGGGLQGLADKFEALARMAWTDVDRDLALAVVEEGLAVAPQHAGLRALRQTLRNGAAAAGNGDPQEVQRLIREAEGHLARGRFTLPEGNNAVETFRRVLRLDPDNPQALRRLDEMAGHFEAMAREDMRGGRAQQAAAKVEQGLMINPRHPGLLALQRQLAPQAAAP